MMSDQASIDRIPNRSSMLVFAPRRRSNTLSVLPIRLTLVCVTLRNASRFSGWSRRGARYLAYLA